MPTIGNLAAHVKRQKRLNHAGLYAGALITWHARYGDQVGLAREMFAHGSAALEFRQDGVIDTQIVQRGAFWLTLGARAMQDAWMLQLRATADALEQGMPQEKRQCPSCLAMESFTGAVCDFCAELPAVLGGTAAVPLWQQIANPEYYEGTDARGTQVRGR